MTLPGSTTSTIIGQIGLTRFINKAGLQPVGNNLFTDTPSSGPPQDGIANAEGYGSHHARQPRAGQCRRGLGNVRPDRRPARLRDERQGDQRRRPDDAIHFRAVPLRKLTMTLRTLIVSSRPPRRRRRAGRSPRRATTSSRRRRCAPTSPSPATWCGSATSSTTPVPRRRSRSTARPISAPPARCRPRRCSPRCGRIR